MRPNYALWLGLFLLVALATLAAHYVPYFPGDVALARWVQALLPGGLGWAEALKQTGDFPWLLLVLALVCSLAWALAGWRAAALALLGLAGIMALGNYVLSPLVARPRPAPGLVRVWRPYSGSSFPSLSVLWLAGTFGYLAILAAVKSSGARRAGLLLGCGALLLAGGVARIVLGAHWPSDVLLSYYLGLLWAACLIRLVLSR